MTGVDICNHRARKILQDTDDTAYNWSDDDLLVFLKNACAFVANRLPESMLTAAYTPADFVWSDLATLNSNLPFDEQYAQALALHVAFQALTMDGQDKRDLARAKEIGTQFAASTGVAITG